MKGNRLKWISQEKYANHCLLHNFFQPWFPKTHFVHERRSRILELKLILTRIQDNKFLYFAVFLFFPKGAQTFITTSDIVFLVLNLDHRRQTCLKFLQKVCYCQIIFIVETGPIYWGRMSRSFHKILISNLTRKTNYCFHRWQDSANWNFLNFIFTARKLRKQLSFLYQ